MSYIESSGLAADSSFDASRASRDAFSFRHYLSLITSYAESDPKATAAYNTHCLLRIASPVLREVVYHTDDTSYEDVPLEQQAQKKVSDEQEHSAIKEFDAMSDDACAAGALVAFGVTANSSASFVQALRRYRRIPPTREAFLAAWRSPGSGAEPWKYTRYGSMGRDIGIGLARAALFGDASDAVRITDANHNEQMAVNSIAYTLADAIRPDTIIWCMREYVELIKTYPDCSINYFSNVLTSACAKLAEVDPSADNELLMRTAIMLTEQHKK